MELLRQLLPELFTLTGSALWCFIAAQICGVGMFVMCILMGQTNRFSHILALKIGANLCQAASCLLMNALSGAMVAGLAAVISALVFVYRQKKGDKIPLWFVAAALVLYCATGVLSYQSLKDLLPIAGGVLFVLSVCAKNTTHYRVIMLCSAIMWLPYDFMVMVYANLLSHVGNFVTYVVGILRFDVFGKKKN